MACELDGRLPDVRCEGDAPLPTLWEMVDQTAGSRFRPGFGDPHIDVINVAKYQKPLPCAFSAQVVLYKFPHVRVFVFPTRYSELFGGVDICPMRLYVGWTQITEQLLYLYLIRWTSSSTNHVLSTPLHQIVFLQDKQVETRYL